jgi:polyphosphate kinase
VGHDEAVAAETTTPESPAVPLDEPPALPADRFLNRELSWLDFNARVLELAEDDTLPLLERVKFLAIFAGNLDEFYMVRIAGLKRRQSTGLTVRSPDGLTIREQLAQVTERHPRPGAPARRRLHQGHHPAPGGGGDRIVHWGELADDETKRLREYFRDQVFPVLTPLAVDRRTPSPTSAACRSTSPSRVRDPDTDAARFARLKVPNNVPRFVRWVGDEARRVGDVPAARGPHRRAPAALFPASSDRPPPVPGHPQRRPGGRGGPRRGPAAGLERELARRRFGPAVRLEVAEPMDPTILDVLVSELEVEPPTWSTCPACWTWPRCGSSTASTGPSSRTSPFVPATHPRLSEGETPKSVFATLREGDVPGPPPVPLVRDQRAALHRAGRRRPERAGDQADAVPHLG